MDVIAMHRAGFKSTVACMGTALTKENAKELKKISSNVVLCFDGDTAGIKATIKSIDILKEIGFNIKIADMPYKKDPDEILKEKGRDYLMNLIENALPVTDYLISKELKKYNLHKADEKGQFLKEVLAHIAKLDSDSEEDPYLEKIRNITSVPIDILRRDLNKIKNKTTLKKVEETSQEKVLISRENGNIRAIKFVLSSLIHKKDFIDKKIDYKKLLPRYKEIIEKAEKQIPISSYFDYFDMNDNPMLKECLDINFDEFKDSGKRYFDECIWQIAYQELLNKQNEVNEAYKNCEDLSQRKEIAKRLQDIMKAIREKNLEDFYVRY